MGRSTCWTVTSLARAATNLHFAFFYPAAEFQTYTHPEIGFTFEYPGDWMLEEAPHYVFLRKGPFRLMIAFRRPEESHQIQPTGLPSGELIEAGSLQFLNQVINRTMLVSEERVKEVLYNGAREIQFKDIAFVVMLDAGQNEYAVIDIPQGVQEIADQVLVSFSMPGIEPLPEILSSEGLGRLAYFQSGDIWVKPLPDGAPIQLTADGMNFIPRWSPSGKWLAYLHGEGQVNLVRADGTGAHAVDLEPVAEFIWSPTADRLAFTLGGERQGELWVVNVDGTGLVNLVPQDTTEDGKLYRIGDFLWHPLGGLILYDSWIEGPDQIYPGLNMWEVDAFTGEDRDQLVKSGALEPNKSGLAGWLAEGKILLNWVSAADLASLLSDGAELFAYSYPLLSLDSEFQDITGMLAYTRLPLPGSNQHRPAGSHPRAGAGDLVG